MKFEEIDFELMYLKAKNGFKQCIELKGNEYLMDDFKELGISIDSITLVDKSIRVEFFAKNEKDYFFEIRLRILSSTNSEKGWYCLVIDKDDQVIDDFLYFDD